jgi:hypothetical protein
MLPVYQSKKRHDAPNFIKGFQTELLYTLFDCKDSTDVLSEGYENALLLVTKTIDKVVEDSRCFCCSSIRLNFLSISIVYTLPSRSVTYVCK